MAKKWEQLPPSRSWKKWGTLTRKMEPCWLSSDLCHVHERPPWKKSSRVATGIDHGIRETRVGPVSGGKCSSVRFLLSFLALPAPSLFSSPRSHLSLVLGNMGRGEAHPSGKFFLDLSSCGLVSHSLGLGCSEPSPLRNVCMSSSGSTPPITGDSHLQELALFEDSKVNRPDLGAGKWVRGRVFLLVSCVR